MPYYTFDLVLEEEFKNQGTIILENLDVASERADQLAIELSQVRPELKATGCAVRVADMGDAQILDRAVELTRMGRRPPTPAIGLNRAIVVLGFRV